MLFNNHCCCNCNPPSFPETILCIVIFAVGVWLMLKLETKMIDDLKKVK